MNTCTRCQGRMVADYGHDQLCCNWAQFFRCLNCVEIMDQVILMNRGFKYEDHADKPHKDKLRKTYNEYVRKESQTLCRPQPDNTTLPASA